MNDLTFLLLSKPHPVPNAPVVKPCLTVKATATRKNRKDQHKQQILEAVLRSKKHGVFVMDVATYTGLSRTHTRDLMYELQREGKVVQCKQPVTHKGSAPSIWRSTHVMPDMREQQKQGNRYEERLAA